MLDAYAGVARAPFLLLPVTLVAVGAAAASRQGAFDPGRTLLALVGLVALHVAVNALNEAGDFASGIDLETERTPFSGGSGTLPEGRLSARAAQWLGVAGATVGCGAGLWFLDRVGWRLLPVLVVGGVAVLAYTGVLARAWLGELSAGLGLGALPVLGTVMVQPAELGPTSAAAALVAFLMTFDLLLLNELPDEGPDRRGGRRNLVLLLGRPAAARLWAGAALAVPATLGAAVAGGALPPAALLAALPTLALVPGLGWAWRRPGEPVPLPALGANVAWNLGTNAVLALCLVLG